MGQAWTGVNSPTCGRSHAIFILGMLQISHVINRFWRASHDLEYGWRAILQIPLSTDAVGSFVAFYFRRNILVNQSWTDCTVGNDQNQTQVNSKRTESSLNLSQGTSSMPYSFRFIVHVLCWFGLWTLEILALHLNGYIFSKRSIILFIGLCLQVSHEKSYF